MCTCLSVLLCEVSNYNSELLFLLGLGKGWRIQHALLMLEEFKDTIVVWVYYGKDASYPHVFV